MLCQGCYFEDDSRAGTNSALRVLVALLMQLYEQAEVDLDGAIVILPAVAFANIGELAIDVLVCTLKAQFVARLEDENLLACVGNNAYSLKPPGLLATATELYHVPGTKVYLLQQRAPAIPGRQKALADNIAQWAKQAGIAHLLLLCGLDAQYRREQQLEGTQLRYLGNDMSAAAAPQVEAQQQQPAAGTALNSSCQAVGLLQLEHDVIATEREVHSLLPPWPILDALSQQGIQYTLMTIFAAEGDNVQDSMALAGKVLGVLQLQGLTSSACGAASGSSSITIEGGGSGSSKPSQQEAALPHLQVPCSWVGLYGRSFDKSLF